MNCKTCIHMLHCTWYYDRVVFAQDYSEVSESWCFINYDLDSRISAYEFMHRFPHQKRQNWTLDFNLYWSTREHCKMYSSTGQLHCNKCYEYYIYMHVSKPSTVVLLGLGVRLTPARTSNQTCSFITRPRIPGSPSLWFVCTRAHQIAQPIGA